MQAEQLPATTQSIAAIATRYVGRGRPHGCRAAARRQQFRLFYVDWH
jgi:hypothetical protein